MRVSACPPPGSVDPLATPQPGPSSPPAEIKASGPRDPNGERAGARSRHEPEAGADAPRLCEAQPGNKLFLNP